MKFSSTEQPSEYTTLVIYGVIILVAVHCLALGYWLFTIIRPPDESVIRKPTSKLEKFH